jgi:hypothetical protein
MRIRALNAFIHFSDFMYMSMISLEILYGYNCDNVSLTKTKWLIETLLVIGNMCLSGAQLSEVAEIAFHMY